MSGCANGANASAGLDMLRGCSGARHPDRKLRHAGKRGQQVVGFVEDMNLRVAFAPGGREKNAGLAAGVERDIGGEAGAAAGLFNHCGRRGRVAEMNPGKADAGRVAGMAQAIG